MAIAGFPADGGVARVIAPAKSDSHILPLPAYVHHSAVGGCLGQTWCFLPMIRSG